MYAEGSPYKQLPELSEYEQLIVSWWHEVGTISQTMGGAGVLEWPVIKAWVDQFHSEDDIEYIEDSPGVFVPKSVRQCTLFDYEVQLIRHLSSEYASEYAEAKEPARPCPKEIDLESLDEATKLTESNALGEALLQMFGGSK